MTNVTVQEALNAAIEVIEQAIPDKRGEFEEQQKLYENYPNLAYKYDYLKVEADEMQQALDKCKSALAEIDKCEPVGRVVQFPKVNGNLYKRADISWNKVNDQDLLYTSPQPIEKCEPVGELILDPVFLPALKAPLVNWKINLVDLEVGTKFYTSPQPREWVGLSDEQITNIGMQHQSLHQVAYAISDALKQLNTKG